LSSRVTEDSERKLTPISPKPLLVSYSSCRLSGRKRANTLMFIPQLLMGDGYLVAEMDCLLRERLLEKGLRTVCLLD
jgi:hypothetical protein